MKKKSKEKKKKKPLFSTHLSPNSPWSKNHLQIQVENAESICKENCCFKECVSLLIWKNLTFGALKLENELVTFCQVVRSTNRLVFIFY